MTKKKRSESPSPSPGVRAGRGRGPAYVVVDTEGSGLHPDDGARISTVSWAYRHPVSGEIVADALPFGQGPPDLFNPETDAGSAKWNAWTEWVSLYPLVFHNAKYDLHMFGAGSITGHHGVDLGDSFYWDTMVAQRSLDPLEPVGLDATCRRFGLPVKDADFLKWRAKNKSKLYSDCPWDVMKPYAVGDAVATLLLTEMQFARLASDEDDWPELDWLLRRMEVTRTLYRMEARGIGFDAQSCLLAAKVLGDEMDSLAADLPFKPSSTTQPRDYYFKTLGLLHVKTTPGGAASMDAEVRRTLVNQEMPHAADFDRWCSLETAKTMWYQSWPEKIGPDGRLRTNYRQTKVVSGRYSVERVQLQAIPHDYRLDGYQLPESVPLVRSFFQPAPGKRLWEFDVSQAEVRVATDLAGCEGMRAAIARGESAHDLTCKRIFKIDESDPEWDRLRSVSKRIRLGGIYGAGPGTVQGELRRMEGLEVDIDTVRGWVNADHRAFPEFVRANVEAEYYAKEHGYIELALGGIRWFSQHEIRTDDLHKAFNQKVQGSVAMVMDEWMLAVEQWHPDVLLLQIHDSLVCELGQDDTDTPKRITAIGEEVFQKEFAMPFVVDVKEWH